MFALSNSQSHLGRENNECGDYSPYTLKVAKWSSKSWFARKVKGEDLRSSVASFY